MLRSRRNQARAFVSCIAVSKSARLRIPGLQRIRRRLSTGEVREHYYYRPTGAKLPPPDSPDFAKAYQGAEEEEAAARQPPQKPVEPNRQSPDPPLNKLSLERGKSTGAVNSTLLCKKPDRDSAPQNGRSVIGLPENLPLYPEEEQIAVAILGPERARQWAATAKILEREGLPPIDPLMGARFWPAVQKFFENRNGLDDGIPAGVKSPRASRVRFVPFAPDGREILDGEEAIAPERR
jgi:hypothetical protein